VEHLLMLLGLLASLRWPRVGAGWVAVAAFAFFVDKTGPRFPLFFGLTIFPVVLLLGCEWASRRHDRNEMSRPGADKNPPPSPSAMLNTILAVAVLLVAGCAATPARRDAKGTLEVCPACVREAGVIGVIATSTVPKFSVQLPLTCEQAANAWRQTLTHGSSTDEDSNRLDERDAVLIQGTMGLGLGCIVAGSLVGQAISGLTAVPPRQLHAANLAMHRAAGDSNLQECIRRCVVARANARDCAVARLVPKPFPPGAEREFSQMSCVMCATLAWLPKGQSATQYLAAQGLDSFLEIQLVHPRLAGRGTVNPALRVEADGRARLVSLRDGFELASVPLHYRGEERKFVAWAADDAKLFRAEIERCGEELAVQCLAGLFSLRMIAGSHSGNCHHHALASQ
jgi:hypothetical protein